MGWLCVWVVADHDGSGEPGIGTWFCFLEGPTSGVGRTRTCLWGTCLWRPVCGEPVCGEPVCRDLSFCLRTIEIRRCLITGGLKSLSVAPNQRGVLYLRVNTSTLQTLVHQHPTDPGTPAPYRPWYTSTLRTLVHQHPTDPGTPAPYRPWYTSTLQTLVHQHPTDPGTPAPRTS